MTSILTELERARFYKELDGMQLTLENVLLFSKDNLVMFNGKDTENYSVYFLDIFARFRLNSEGVLYLLPAFRNDYRLKISVNLLLRSICSDVLAALYLFTFYDKDDPENLSLKNELEIVSAEFFRSVNKIIEEDHQLLTTHQMNLSTSLEDKRNWFNKATENLLNEDGKIKTRGQLRATTKDHIKEGLTTGGGFISEEEKYKRIISKGLSQFGFSFTIFKYYSQFQHFNLASKKLIELNPFHDTFLMAVTIDQMLMTIDLILQNAKSPNPNFREEIQNIRDSLLQYFA